MVRVVDGDTVQVLADGKMQKVRLNGIDASESGQPFGQRSKQNLLKLAAQKQTEVIASSTDRYGRWLGTLIIDGININAEQVKTGMAWAYRYRGHATDINMLRLETAAKENKVGLWSTLILLSRGNGGKNRDRKMCLYKDIFISLSNPEVIFLLSPFPLS